MSRAEGMSGVPRLCGSQVGEKKRSIITFGVTSLPLYCLYAVLHFVVITAKPDFV